MNNSSVQTYVYTNNVNLQPLSYEEQYILLNEYITVCKVVTIQAIEIIISKIQQNEFPDNICSTCYVNYRTINVITKMMKYYNKNTMIYIYDNYHRRVIHYGGNPENTNQIVKSISEIITQIVKEIIDNQMKIELLKQDQTLKKVADENGVSIDSAIKIISAFFNNILTKNLQQTIEKGINNNYGKIKSAFTASFIKFGKKILPSKNLNNQTK